MTIVYGFIDIILLFSHFTKVNPLIKGHSNLHWPGTFRDGGGVFLSPMVIFSHYDKLGNCGMALFRCQ